MSLFDLTGKKALVTGASRGLGYAITEGLREHGADVAMISSCDEIFEASQRLAGLTNRQVFPLKGNLGIRTELARVFEKSLELLGTLDILVVSHGIQRRHDAQVFPLRLGASDRG